MRIAKVVRVYSMDVPVAASQRKVNFFDTSPYQTLYFRSSEERENYKTAYCSRLHVKQYDDKEAIYEKDENSFAVVFSANNDPSMVGFAVSKVYSADKMVGTWTVKNGTMTAEETCERIAAK